MGEVLKASGPGPDQIHVGMNVVSIDGESIGHVKEVRSQDFLVDRRLARDVYVPYEAVLSVPERAEDLLAPEVRLNVSASHIDAQHWPNP